MPPVISVLLAILCVQVLPWVACWTLMRSTAVQRQGLPRVYGFATGALFMNVGVHLAPEYLHTEPKTEHLLPALVWGVVLLGVSRLKRHSTASTGSRTLQLLWWLADTLHNLLDNLQLILGFLHSSTVGWLQTLVLFLHELPQEIAEWSVFHTTGLTMRQVVVYNLIGLAASLGMTAVFWASPGWIQLFTPYLLPIILVNFSLVFYRLLVKALISPLNHLTLQGMLIGALTSGLVLYITH